jgi:putative methyltransferase (TIGR04325 family)
MPMPGKRDTTPTWLLPAPIRRLRLVLRQTKDLAADTHQQVVEARSEQNASMARLETQLQEIASDALSAREARNGHQDANSDAGSPPEWEFVAEGWARSGEIRGWRAEEVARAYREKWPQFLQAVEGPGPLGVNHEVPVGTPITRDDPLTQNAVLAWAYVLARARRDAGRISVLDWGGALGHHYLLARELFPELKLDYHCRELPAVCVEGRRVLGDVTFHDDDRCLGSTYGVVLASNSLQYEEDWPSRLEDLAGAAHDWLFLTRVPVAYNHPSFVVLQRAYRYGYGTEYLGWALSRHELLDAASAFGLRLVREFALLPPFSVDGAPDAVTHMGFLFSRSAGNP